MSKPSPLIVDLLPSTKTIIPSNNVPVIGKFEGKPTSSLDLALTAVRALVVIEEILKRGENPSPIQFYIDECWQAFAIVSAAVHHIGIEPKDTEIVVMTSSGELVVFALNLIFTLKGGDDLKEPGKSFHPSFTITNNSQKESPHE